MSGASAVLVRPDQDQQAQAQAAAYVVEDDDAYRELLTIAVRDHCGIATVHAWCDGTAALQAFAAAAPSEQPGIVLLDFHMPGPTGLEVLRSLRALGFRGQAVVISNAASAGDRRACEDEGACVLNKPARFDELIAMLSAVVMQDEPALHVRAAPPNPMDPS